MPPNDVRPIWLDAQLSASLAVWLSERFGRPAFSFRFLGLHDAEDERAYRAARAAKAIVMTKDADFPQLLRRLGPPPAVIWLTFGNTSNAALRNVLERTLAPALELVQLGEPLVEIADHPEAL